MRRLSNQTMAPVDQQLPGAASPEGLPNTTAHCPDRENETSGASGGKAEAEGVPSSAGDSDSNLSGDDSDSHGGGSEVEAEDDTHGAAAVGAQQVEQKTISESKEGSNTVTADHLQGAAAVEAQQVEQHEAKEGSQPNGNQSVIDTDRSVETKAESLAEYIILNLLGKCKKNKSNDKVERTLLRCVKTMMSKHELLFKGMMKRLTITQETGYMTFVSVAHELFEGDKIAVNWGRIVALYSFGGQLALHCAENQMEDFAMNIAKFMGRYSSEVVAPFVRKSGGWNKLCEEYPEEEDLENKAWNFLTWTALGLGIVSAVSFFTSH